jgi:hypothetical protein
MAEKKKTLGSVLNEGLNGQFARAMEKLSPVEKNFCDFLP